MRVVRQEMKAQPWVAIFDKENMKNMAFEKNIDDILISDLQATQVAGGDVAFTMHLLGQFLLIFSVE